MVGKHVAAELRGFQLGSIRLCWNPKRSRKALLEYTIIGYKTSRRAHAASVRMTAAG